MRIRMRMRMGMRRRGVGVRGKSNSLHNDGGEICLALLVVSEVPEL